MFLACVASVIAGWPKGPSVVILPVCPRSQACPLVKSCCMNADGGGTTAMANSCLIVSTRSKSESIMGFAENRSWHVNGPRCHMFRWTHLLLHPHHVHAHTRTHTQTHTSAHTHLECSGAIAATVGTQQPSLWITSRVTRGLAAAPVHAPT